MTNDFIDIAVNAIRALYKKDRIAQRFFEFVALAIWLGAAAYLVDKHIDVAAVTDATLVWLDAVGSAVGLALARPFIALWSHLQSDPIVAATITWLGALGDAGLGRFVLMVAGVAAVSFVVGLIEGFLG